MSYDGTLKFDTKLDTSGYQSGINKIKGIGSGAVAVTKNILTAAAGAVTAIGGYATKVGMDFEAGMSKVEAISSASSQTLVNDVGQVVNGLDGLTEKAKEMGAKTKFSATESSEALSYMAMAGWDAQEMYDGLAGVMNLAAASGEDLGRTSDIVTDALTAFGLEAKDSGHFADVLAQTSASANTNVSLMGETFKYVAPVAGAMGFNIEDCSLAIGLMANSGIKGSQAGTALRNVFTRLVKPTKQSQEAIEKLGLQIQNEDGSMKSLDDIIGQLRTSFSGLTDAQKASYASALAGQYGMSGLLAIVNATDEDVTQLKDSIGSCDGAAERMAETMNDNLQGAITILKSSIEGLGITFYEGLEEPAKEVVQKVIGIVNDMNAELSENGLKGLGTAFGHALADIARMALDFAPTIITTATDTIHAMAEAILDNKESFGTAGAELFTALIEGLISVTADIWTVAVELLAQFLAGLDQNMPDIIAKGEEILSNFAQSLIDNAPSIASSAASIIGQLAQALIEHIPDIMDTGRKIIQGIIDGISEEYPAFGAFLDGIFGEVSKTIGPLLEGAYEAVKKIFEAFGQMDPETARKLGAAVAKVVEAFVAFKTLKTITGTFSSITKGMSGLVGNTMSFATKANEAYQLWAGGAGTLTEVLALEFPKIGAIVAKIGGLFGSGGLLASIGSGLASAASAAATGIASLGTTIISGLGAVVAAIGVGPLIAIAAAIAAIIAVICNWDAVKTFFTETLPQWWTGTAWPAITSVFQAAGQWLSELPGKVLEFFNGIITTLGGWAESAGTWVSENVPLIIEAIVTFFQELPYKIGYAIGYVIGTLIEWGANVIDWIAENIPLMIEAICEFFSELPGRIWDFLRETWDKLVQWGSDMLDSAQEAATNIIDTLCEFFSELPGKIWDFLTETYENFLKWGSDTLDNARKTASDIIDTICEFFRELPGNVWSFLTETFDKFKQWGSDTINSARETASDVVDTIGDFFKKLPGNVWSFLTETFDNLVEWGSNMIREASTSAWDISCAIVDTLAELPWKMADIGYNIVMGLWDGINGMIGWFTDQIWGFFSGIVDGAQAALGIYSPSRKMRQEVGKYIPPGVTLGMEDAMPDMLDDVDKQMAKLSDHMTATVSAQTAGITLKQETAAGYRALEIPRTDMDDTEDGDQPITLYQTINVDGEPLYKKATQTTIKELNAQQQADDWAKGRI